MARGSCRDRPQTPTPAAAEAIEDARRRHRRDRPPAGTATRKRAERKLGLLLVAPAVIIMLAVAAYPILYAFWLSLNKADLRKPNANQFIGFENYVTVLSSPIWWTAFGVTMFITVVSAFFELVFGMILAIIMHRTIVGRGLVRTSALVPYAIVTVVAAFSWRFAWTEDLGYLTPSGSAPLTAVLAVDLDHHPGRGLEDDPVHGAAADGRSGAGARGPAQGGLDGRRERRGSGSG